MNQFAQFLGGILKVLKTPLKLWTRQQKLTAVVTSLSVVLAGLVTTVVVLEAREETPQDTTPSTSVTTGPTTQPSETTQETTEPTVETTEPGPVITDKVLELQEMAKENPHVVGWVYVPDTRIDEVVMFSPDWPDFYLYSKPDGSFSAAGTVYIDEICSLDPPTQVLQMYGHNMLSGAKFADLLEFEKKSFWQKHPYIYYTTLEEAKTYEVVSILRDRDLPPESEELKYYDFVSPATEEEFDKYMDYFIENSLIDTGVTAEYSDNFIMLVTCTYHVKDGRFIVLAKEVPYVEPAE